MALGTVPISHTTLDFLGPSHRIRYLRRLLISAKTLPEIDIYVNDLDLFAQRLLETLSTEHAHLLRRYYRWHILRFLSLRYSDSHVSSSVVDGRRHQLTAIRDLLAWLEGQSQSLATCAQMKHSDVTITDESVSVRFATDPVTMPLAVGDLLRTYVNDPVVRTIYRTEGTEWLFSGLMPTTHITPSRLGELLLAVGISPRAAKDAAM